ncbi:MAG: adenylate/guanylate cyclase domain-containing protein [Gemmatimonadota bacterium]
MEPRIQYAKTKDGVSIAFYAVGEGMPFVHMPAQFSHIQLEWQWPEVRAWMERLAAMRKLVRYDGRGRGLSDRDATDYSLDAQVLDLEAVVDRLGLERFALWGWGDSGPVAIAYAARCPQRVSHLVLWCTYAKTSDPPWMRAMDELIKKDWEIATETVAHSILGWSAGDEASSLAAFMRESVTPDALMALSAAADEFDVTSLLAQVRVPTLVLHRREIPFPEVGVARELASRIPDARLALLEGKSAMSFMGDTEAVLTAIDEFLGEGEEATAGEKPLASEDIHTILFTDMEGSTALTARLGDAKARDLLREHERLVREALKTHGGSEVKTMGDGFMASFSSASKALECAIAMQRAFAAHNESAAEPIMVRVGLNAGEPIAEDEDLFGTAVNLAARICSQAEAGQILAPIVVRELAAGKQFMFADLGDTELRGFEDPVRVYEVRWREAG